MKSALTALFYFTEIMDSYNSLAKLYDKFSFDTEAKDWAGYICELLKRRGVTKGCRVLDAGCGTGKITVQLYKAGYNVTALDNSAQMLEVAARRFASAGAGIQIAQLRFVPGSVASPVA